MSWITCSGFCDLQSDVTAAVKKHQLAPRKRGMSGSAVVFLPSAATKSSHNGPLIKKKKNNFCLQSLADLCFRAALRALVQRLNPGAQ